MTISRVALIGAGLAGLTCAHELAAAGVQVQLFDKSRGPGGRLSTRRSPAGPFDHGGADFAAVGSDFAQQVEQWTQAGWLARVDDTRHTGMGSMNALPRALAQGLPVQLEAEIAAIEPDSQGLWKLRAHQAVPGLAEQVFDAVVVAVPAEQAVPLLGAAPALADAVRPVRSDPTWTVMAAWPLPLPARSDRLRPATGPLREARRDDTRPGRERVAGVGCRWVLHATPDWSAHNLDAPPEQVLRRLLEAFSEALGVRLARPVHAVAHRWRYAQVPAPLSEPCGWDAALRIGACGDGWHGATGAEGVERAWLSARALAQRLLNG
ncbi:NAD(P)/FAD-dependent oxidoreductase [Caldimonas sp.]|uniref:NAD(P)/FAD-dependent oxidoreductase n=1 Tax=Caldimonas sp. TaxID=2838790 RepID=UPI00391A33B9